RYGAIDFSITEISRALASLIPGRPEPTLDQRIFLELRFPRAILCLLVGASLWSLPIAACAGGVISTYLVFLLARSREDGRASIVMLLLTGLAVNALFMSAIGFLSYIARDPQARSITFWSLGTLSGASWKAVEIVTISTVVGTAIALRYAKQL